MRSLKPARLLLFILVLSGMTAIPQTSRAVEQWGCQEVVLKGAAAGNAYLETKLSAKFTHGTQNIEVPGFWDGGDVFKIRFMPPAPGQWRDETQSNRPELSGKRGSFDAIPPAGNNHGPVVAYKTSNLRFADGTPYHQFGTTCYAWTHQTEELQEQTLRTLATSPFNKIRFCVFPKSYTFNKNEPTRFAFTRRSDGMFDFDRPDTEFWRHFEGRILDLQKLGIQADLILWHPYDRWGFSEMSKAQDDRYLRYCIARLAAFRNVWWSLANEYDLMLGDNARKLRGNKTMDDWDRFFSILEKEDPAQHLRGIHNCRGFYDHTKAWVSHASVQSSDMNAGVRFRQKYQKPIIYDECKYEGNIPNSWGKLSAREMTQRFWLGTMSGCYVGHGETYLNAEEVLWWSKGGVLRGESPKRIQWLKEFMAKAPAFETLQPIGDDKGRFILAGSDGYHLLYCVTQTPQTIHLPGTQPYKVDAIYPWEMKELPAGTAPAGDFTVTPSKPDMAYRFTPQKTGAPPTTKASRATSLTPIPTRGVPR